MAPIKVFNVDCIATHYFYLHMYMYIILQENGVTGSHGVHVQ